MEDRKMQFIKSSVVVAVIAGFSGIIQAMESCGRVLFLDLNCPIGYHCCSPRTSICCPNHAICIQDDKACLHIAAIIVPIFIFIGLVLAIALCCYCCRRRRAQQGVVLQPGNQGPAPSTQPMLMQVKS